MFFCKNKKELSLEEKIKGSLYGFFVGDALGVPVEFINRQTLKNEPVTDMLEYGSHNQPKGSFSDDTSLVLATIDSMINNKDTLYTKEILNYKDIMYRFTKYKLKGEYTPQNHVFDIGLSTAYAIDKYIRDDNNPFCGEKDINSNGNGSLMRALPLALYDYFCIIPTPTGTIFNDYYEYNKKLSSLTHAHDLSVMSCYIYNYFISEYLITNDIRKSYENTQSYFKILFDGKVKKDYGNLELSKKYFERLIYNDISKLKREDIKSSGFVIDTIEAVFYTILTTNNYKEAVLSAVNLGDDTDTVGAITGSLAGLIYGLNDIPNNWLNTLQRKDYLDNFVNKYFELINERIDYNEKEKKRVLEEYERKEKERPKATKDSWKNLRFPEQLNSFEITKELTKEQLEILKFGHIPREMEDHWFFYDNEEEKTINFYRSWTGIGIYKAYYNDNNTIYKVEYNQEVLSQNKDQIKKDFNTLIDSYLKYYK